jgi:hypothetical protein
MKVLVSLLLGIIGFPALAQDSPVQQEFPDVESSFCSEGIGFPGGKTALDEYLQSNLNFSGIALLQDTVVYTRFTVSDNGEIKHVFIENFTNTKITHEIERVIYSMPLWSASYRNGKRAEYQVSIPIRIILQDPNDQKLPQSQKPH